LKQEVDAIESAKIPQGDKTRKYKAAALKVKNALFLDKRKYKGNGSKNRISLNTYNAYITRIRKQFDDRLHHSFCSNVERLAAKYPVYSSELLEWVDMPAASIRQALGVLQNKLREIIPLAEALSGIKKGSGAEKKLARLAKKYPAWAIYLTALSTDWKQNEPEMHKAFQQGTRLLDDLNSLRVNHEILYHLQLSPAERATIQKQWDDVLDSKKRNTISLDYPVYMQRVTDLLNAPFAPNMVIQRKDMAPVAFALAAVSGRRMIEVMLQGEFEAVGNNEVMFYGQAKKRTGTDSGRKVYTLCNAKLFVERINELRSCPAADDFNDIVLDNSDESYRSANMRINSILANTFNQFAKDFFNDDRRTYKDTRAIYARIAYEGFFRHDPRWKNVDEDVFFAEILGHDDENTQLHYKQFKLVNFSRSWRPEKGVENRRLAALQTLDEAMPEFARGDAGVRIHDFVKGLVEAGGNIVINTNTLRKAGFNPTLTRRYLDFAADALGQTVGDNGWLQNGAKEQVPVIMNTNDDTEEEEDQVAEEDVDVQAEAKPESKPVSVKPMFKPAVKNSAGMWVIEFNYAGQRYAWTGPADNSMAAMSAAWTTYFPE
jgi:hypothetical protein